MSRTAPGDALEVLGVFGRLGLTSFGGPIAHLGFFRTELVERRRWLTDEQYADLVALCQFLPGPASSQVGVGIGLLRAGPAGAVAAFVGFTLPSAVLMLAFAWGASAVDVLARSGVLAGLVIAAVAVVAHAVLGMARTLAPDRTRATIAVVALATALLVPGPAGQVVPIALGALVGVWLCRAATGDGPSLRVPVRRGVALGCLAAAVVLLVALPLLAAVAPDGPLALADAFYRSGALVFGGGHVVLPLLNAELAGPGWVSEDQLLAGYGAAQAVPGPLFSVAAYLGAVADVPPGGVLNAVVGLVALFLPGMLLLVGTLPFWDALRRRERAQGAMRGASAAVVGILAAALYTPVFTTAVVGPAELALAALCLVLLTAWRLPPWAVVLVGAGGGLLLG